MTNNAFTLINPDLQPTHPEGPDFHGYRLRSPKPGISTPLIVSCPHAGIHIPPRVIHALAVPEAEVLARGDRFTDWLTVNAPKFGATQIISTIAPTILNVGRAITSLDAKDIRGGAGNLVTELDKYTDKGKGQGIVAFKTLYDGQPLYSPGHEPDAAEIQNRIDTYYTPFHDKLDKLVLDTRKKHGYALVFDIHSAPSIGTHADVDTGKKRADVIFSNNSGENGASADPVLLAELMDLAREHRLTSDMNYPYRGGYVTQAYGANGPKGEKNVIEAFQIEYSRAAIGIDERTLKLKDRARFESVQHFTNAMLQHLANYATDKAAGNNMEATP